MAAHQAPPSLGFSRQEHWSGLPFPSPMHESEKWKRIAQSATPWTAAHQAPLSMVFSRQEYWSGVPLPSPWFLLGRPGYPLSLSQCCCPRRQIGRAVQLDMTVRGEEPWSGLVDSLEGLWGDQNLIKVTSLILTLMEQLMKCNTREESDKTIRG